MIVAKKEGFRLCYGGLELPFQVETRARKSLSITVHPNRALQVLAPLDADLETVLARVDKRASWIAKQWRHFAAADINAGVDQSTDHSANQSASANTRSLFAGTHHQYRAGETHWYQGRAFRLQLSALGDSASCEFTSCEPTLFQSTLFDSMRYDEEKPKTGVSLHGRFLHIVTATPHDPAAVARLLEAWYRQRAAEVFALWLDKCLAGARSLSIVAPPTVEIRKMQKRWGSCTASGKILLNLDLVKTPVDCIEYVIFHELCHLQVPHHGPQFYALLGRFLPDWRERKAKLETWGQKV